MEFSLEGNIFHWDLKVEEDWVDSAIFTKFIELLNTRKVSKKFIGLTFGGQDCLIGYLSPEQLDKLKKVTGLNITWLN